MSKARTGGFVSLEGGEGAGKSTLLWSLARAFESRDIEVVTTREPGGTPLAEAIRNIVLHPPEDEAWTPLAEALLMNTARNDHLEKLIRPALERGALVLTDRFADSTRAYQSVGGSVAQSSLKAIEDVVVEDTQPDITFILDAPPEHLARRRQERGGEADTFELRNMEFHKAVREAFLKIATAAPERCVVLDAMEPADHLLKQALEICEERFGMALS